MAAVPCRFCTEKDFCDQIAAVPFLKINHIFFIPVIKRIPFTGESFHNSKKGKSNHELGQN